jgi:cytochrome c biogenesis protein CcmG/thiol:disulfide interchange protein DsbE
VLLLTAVVIPLANLLVQRHAARPGRLPTPPASYQVVPAGTRPAVLHLKTLDGGSVDLASLAGRPVVVNFWASWCAPCVQEFPLLRQAQADHRADGLALVGVIVNDDPEAARAFVRRMGATWPSGIGTPATIAAFGLRGLPETLFIRRDGTVASRQLGQLSPASLRAQLAAIVGE